MFRSSLEATVTQLQRMAGWHERGSFGYRLASYNPGFSLVAVDPGARHGVVIVEFHGFHNQVTNTRMHVELSRDISDQWYSYWLTQFERIWEAAREPAASQPGGRVRPVGSWRVTGKQLRRGRSGRLAAGLLTGLFGKVTN